MKRLWHCGERTPASGQDAGGFSDGTSFHSGGIPGHASGIRAVAGGVPGETRCTSGHKDRIPHVARHAPDHAGRTSCMTGGIPGVTECAPGVARRTPAGKRCAPGVKRCAPDDARCVSGVSGDVSGVDRCMELKDLCDFTLFTIFPFGAVKQNTEKQQTTTETKHQ
jgi:hypothetical protein